MKLGGLAMKPDASRILVAKIAPSSLSGAKALLCLWVAASADLTLGLPLILFATSAVLRIIVSRRR